MSKLDPIDPVKVENLAANGVCDADIAESLGRSLSVLQRRFARHLRIGRARHRISILKAQNKLARKGNAAVLIWLGKNELGQTDRPIPSGEPEPLMDPKVG
jgi:IS30 family transposase